MALSLPGPDTLDAGIISKRWRSIERSSLEGSVLKSHTITVEGAGQKADTHKKSISYWLTIMCGSAPNINMITIQTHQEVLLHPSL